MVGLKNPCKKCIVQSSCSQACDEYRSYYKKFAYLFSSEKLSAFLTILIISILIICPFFGMKTKTFFIFLGIHFIFGASIGVLSYFISKEMYEDRLFDIFKFISITITGLPSLVGVLLSQYLEKFSECSAYKR
mgnify:CR=1 FL=1